MYLKLHHIKEYLNSFMLFPILIFFANSITTCVNPVDGTPPDESPPNLFIYAPSAEDTVYVGQNEIIYEVIDDIGVSYFEVYVDDELANKYEVDPELESTPIYLNLDDNKKDQIITVEVFAYDLAGNKS